MYLHLPLTFMIAAAGLVASAAIPISLGPDSTSTSRSSDATTSLNLIKRAVEETHILKNPISPDINAKTSASLIEYHNSMVDEHIAARQGAEQAVEGHQEEVDRLENLHATSKDHKVTGLDWDHQRAKAQRALTAAKASVDYHKQWELAHQHLRSASIVATDSKSGMPNCGAVAKAFAHHEAALEAIPPHYEGDTPTQADIEASDKRKEKWMNHSQELHKTIMSDLQRMSASHRSSHSSGGTASFGIPDEKLGRAPPVHRSAIQKFQSAIGCNTQ
ncbi:hypothetical protein FRB91_011025 [Serendipita sp. 411]|nr:hypothetical protein FRC18_005389 [Serendipita sp. 400]KAG8848211.1 hypothetical protein FRB91_011025 [Serendipita sp. 411]